MQFSIQKMSWYQNKAWAMWPFRANYAKIKMNLWCKMIDDSFNHKIRCSLKEANHILPLNKYTMDEMIKSDIQIIHLFSHIRVFHEMGSTFLFSRPKTHAPNFSKRTLVWLNKKHHSVWWNKRYANLLSSLIDTWHIHIKSWANSIYAVIVTPLWY